MRVTFLGIGMEQLGISLLSAIAKEKGHQVNLAFSAQLFNDRYNLQFPKLANYFDDTDLVIKRIIDNKPDVLAFGALTSTYQWGLRVAEKVKNHNPDVKVVFGGVHPSAVPDLAIKKKQIDYVVVGEGDIAFPIILENIDKGDFYTPIPNTRFLNPDGKLVRGVQGGFIQNLDNLPFYDKSLWENDIRIGDLYMTLATRGCPYRCTFCFNNFFAELPEVESGKYVRLRSVDHVIGELKEAKKRYKLKFVDFQDDVFGTQKKWLREFSEKYKKEINVPFQILTHPKFMDDETARLLSHAGCKWVQMGVQSMDDDYKKESLLRYEKKEDIERALKVMHKYHIKVKLDHMFGLPNEPISAQENAFKLYSENHMKRIQTFWTCYLPGTQMMNEAIAEGKLTPMQIDRINEGDDFYFYRNTDNVKDIKTQKLYLAYEFIFKIIPALPFFIRRRIKAEYFTWLPETLHFFITFIVDLFLGFRSVNPVFKAYLRHNLFHLRRFFYLKITGKEIKAIHPKLMEVKLKRIDKEKLSDEIDLENSVAKSS